MNINRHELARRLLRWPQQEEGKWALAFLRRYPGATIWRGYDALYGWNFPVEVHAEVDLGDWVMPQFRTGGKVKRW